MKYTILKNKKDNISGSNCLSKLPNTKADTNQSVDNLNEKNSNIKERQDAYLKRAKLMEELYNSYTYKEYIFEENQRVEAYIAYQEIISKAKQSIIYIDDYMSAKTLQLLKACNPGINITLVTDNLSNLLNLNLVNDFKKDTNINPTIIPNLNAVHDRYIFIDFNTPNEKIFQCDHSAADAGSRFTRIISVEPQLISHDFIDNLLLNQKSKLE